MRDLERALRNTQALAWPLYGAGLLMIVLPAADLVANVWPANVGQLEWRFGTVGLLAGYLLTPVFGVLMIAFGAALLGHRMLQRLLAIANVLAAVLFAGVIVIFALDWLQLRATLPAEARATMDLGSGKALFREAVVAALLLWLGIVGWRISRRSHGDARAARPSPPLVRKPGEE